MDSTVFVPKILTGFGQLNYGIKKKSVICNFAIAFQVELFSVSEAVLTFWPFNSTANEIKPIFLAHCVRPIRNYNFVYYSVYFLLFSHAWNFHFITSFSFYKTEIPLWSQIYTLPPSLSLSLSLSLSSAPLLIFRTIYTENSLKMLKIVCVSVPLAYQ